MAEKEISINQEQEQLKINKPITEMVDLQKGREEIVVPRELKTWMEKVESETTTLNQPTNGNNNDDSGLQPIATTVTKITLPSDKKNFVTGFKKPVNEAWRWFSEFLLRIIKKENGKVKFKEE
jgi:hypothetical protein